MSKTDIMNRFIEIWSVWFENGVKFDKGSTPINYFRLKELRAHIKSKFDKETSKYLLKHFA